VDSPRLREQVKIAAARSGVTVSAYCQEAIRRRLEEEGQAGPGRDRSRAAARALDVARRRYGPLGVPVSELIAEGRRR
jgi:hypothetical protein